MPGITIVIPLHNRADLICRTLDSVAAQTYRPLHLIVIDNASTDNGAEVVSRWMESHCDGSSLTGRLLHEPTPGAAAARNRGLQEVTTEYTMFFDSDDIMLPTHVERAMAGFASPTAPDIVGWDVTYCGNDGLRSVKHFYTSDTQWHNIMHGGMSTQRYAAKTEIFRRAGMWNPYSRGWNDVELGSRILLLNPLMMKLQGEPTVEVINTAVSITGKNFSDSSQVWEHTLDLMHHTLSLSGKGSYADCRRAILAGCYAREGHPDKARALMAATLSDRQPIMRRLLLRLAAAYTAIGLRGAARLLRPFF